ncbi:MAG TPA: hypothetical protein VMC09_16005 [Anaerolineales bacterium]|nr:hypothetical protein [Anaerolineales bacterium]
MKNVQQQTMNTGDILDQGRDRSREYTAETQEISFTPEQHAVWAELFAGIHRPYFLENICQAFSQGLDLLQLDPHRLPTVAYLNKRIQPRTGWRIERTAVRYTLAEDWYKKFAQRVFLITDYLRSRQEMEFTPEPDMFHDIFGHLPYLTQEFYARIEDRFAPAYLKATPDEKEVIKRLAWYTTEFGLVVEDGRFKVFGAGTISGRSELANTIMEFYRLSRDKLIDYRGDLFAQLQDHFLANQSNIQRIIAGVNELHQKGQMSSQEQGWNVVERLYHSLGIDRGGYLGGEVILAPFDLEMIARLPKTVYAFNPIFFVCESLEQMDKMLDSYLTPISRRNT